MFRGSRSSYLRCISWSYNPLDGPCFSVWPYAFAFSPRGTEIKQAGEYLVKLEMDTPELMKDAGAPPTEVRSQQDGAGV